MDNETAGCSLTTRHHSESSDGKLKAVETYGLSTSKEAAEIRFIADLSPESAFVINANRQGGAGDISRHVVGLWLGQKRTEASSDESSAGDDQRTDDVPTKVLNGSAGQPLLLSTLRPALRRECLTTIPTRDDFDKLAELFYAKVDPVFPLLRDEPWEKHGAMETVALEQCICLIASLDPSMRPYLRLPHCESPLPQLDFRTCIAAALKQSLDLGFLADKVVLLQVCTFMSMYVDKQGFGELSTYYCAQAVLHEQTLGFHVGWPDGKAGAARSHRILWCVWVLDRLNAATNGRPTLIHRRDMDRKVLESVEEQPAPFRLLIRIAQYLDHTISLYRPHATGQGQAEHKDQTFEDLVELTGAHNLTNGLLGMHSKTSATCTSALTSFAASLELFYLAVVILRGRSKGQRPSSELQWFCAARIVAVASGEHKSSLIFWPLLPYSVTVAASVAYRSLRNSPMPYNRKRAYKLFQDSCEVLDELSLAFLSAKAMARLAMETMQEVERVAAERTRRTSLRSTVTTPMSIAQPEGGAQLSTIIHNSSGSHQTAAEAQEQQTTGVPAIVRSTATMLSNHPDQNLFGDFDDEAGVFGGFDPSFDLGKIDAIFLGNLDPSAPPFAENWSSPAGLFPWSQTF